MGKFRDKFGRVSLPGSNGKCTHKPLSRACMREQSFVRVRIRRKVITSPTFTDKGLVERERVVEEIIPFTQKEIEILGSHKNHLCKRCRYDLSKALFNPEIYVND